MDSIWTKTARLPRFEPLRSDLNTDVLIIGGGLAGVLCAYKPARAGVNYALVGGGLRLRRHHQKYHGEDHLSGFNKWDMPPLCPAVPIWAAP